MTCFLFPNYEPVIGIQTEVHLALTKQRTLNYCDVESQKRYKDCSIKNKTDYESVIDLLTSETNKNEPGFSLLDFISVTAMSQSSHAQWGWRV